MLSALEFLNLHIDESNIPKDHYEWEIADMMDWYADYYHTEMIKQPGFDNQNESNNTSIKAKFVNESMYENEGTEFANRMYSLESELEELNPHSWQEFELETGKYWEKLGVSDWQNAFDMDPMVALGFEEELRTLILNSK